MVDPFCFRQFKEHAAASSSYTGTVFEASIAQFEDIVNQQYDPANLKDGYAPFCKHLFVENSFTNARVNVLKITPENVGRLRTQYEARNQKELPVLQRFFPRELVGDDLPQAKYLDLILYSREQIDKETAAQGSLPPSKKETAPWGIVSIKAQDVDHELPMNPITMFRNALGKEQGGSGVDLDTNEYLRAVEYWKDHAVVT